MNTLFEKTTGKDEWLTPPKIIKELGPFDLDPCSPVTRPWPTAKRHLTIHDDGLRTPWEGRVWCNPPYGKDVGKWLLKCSMHGNVIALVFARTETHAFQDYVWHHAKALRFIKGRLQFYRTDGTCIGNNAGAPSVLVAFDHWNAMSLINCNIPGHVVLNRP